MLFFVSDIDECDLRIDDCVQICTNEVGGYTCSCEAGFTLDTTDNASCIGKFFSLSDSVIETIVV